MQGTQRYVVFAYLALGLIVWTTIAKIFGAVAYTANLPDPAIIGSNFPLSNLLGLVIALGLGFYAFRHPVAHSFSSDVVNELRKVSWPSRQETQTATIVVIITTLILAAVLGVFDAVWAELTSIIYAKPKL